MVIFQEPASIRWRDRKSTSALSASCSCVIRAFIRRRQMFLPMRTCGLSGSDTLHYMPQIIGSESGSICLIPFVNIVDAWIAPASIRA